MIPRTFMFTIAVLFGLSVAMSTYLWQLRRRELLRPAPSLELQHVAPPASGAIATVTVYVVHDNPGELRPQALTIPLAADRQERAAQLLRALGEIYAARNSPHPLAAGAELRDVFLVEPGWAVVDLNLAFVEGQVSGVLAEELTVASIVETLARNIPNLEKVKILVDGKERETLAGHADLSGFYDVTLVGELAKDLAPK